MTEDAVDLALRRIVAETQAAFDWLIEGFDRHAAVTFVPNPGNVGDAAIDLACFQYLQERFTQVRICAMTAEPVTECVFIGGGGNFVESLYVDTADFLRRIAASHRLFFFPSTIEGYEELLRRVAPVTRCLCREAVSYGHVRALLPPGHARLTHDAAFLLGPGLRRNFAGRIARSSQIKCRAFREDTERKAGRPSGFDVMGEYQSEWTDMALAKLAVEATAKYLLGFQEVKTDRLHCAILAAMLGRRTALYSNSYFKNAAVFAHSLSRFPNVRFDPDDENDA